MPVEIIRSTPIEFNSNARVIERTNNIIDTINFTKRNKDLTSCIDAIRDFYMEIIVDLKEEEKGVWSDIKLLIQRNRPIPKDSYIQGISWNEGKLWALLDDCDMKLRILAKKHGYLASNKADPRRAITER